MNIKYQININILVTIARDYDSQNVFAELSNISPLDLLVSLYFLRNSFGSVYATLSTGAAGAVVVSQMRLRSFY